MSLKSAAKKLKQDADEALVKQHEGVCIESTGDLQIIELKSKTVRTMAAALAVAEVDESIWEVESCVINKWDSAGIIKTPTGKKLAATELWQVKLKLRRRAPKLVQDGIAILCERLAKHKPPKVNRPKRNGGLLLEVSIVDTHFGKLCWGEETGDNYDTKIAERIYQHAIEDLLRRTAGEQIQKIWFPIGNDFFHVNNWLNTTAKGTSQDHDGRAAKVFVAGEMALIRAVDLCRQIAPVELFRVPGNHDPETSYYLLRVLASYYRDTPDVTVDTSPMSRKIKTFGKVFLMFTHGDEEPHRDLPNIAATSAPKEWAATCFREAHVGHFHKKKEMRTVDVDEFQGFRTRILPSLSGTDKWHFGRGYVNGQRAAEAYLWSASDGYMGHFSVNARAS